MKFEADINCPRCGNILMGAEENHPLSRLDNKTRICNDCGTDEAMWDYVHPGADMPPLDQPCRRL